MNAGPHTFHFEGADGASVDRSVLVKEGERNQAVVVTLAAAPVAPTLTPAAATPQEAASAPVAPASAPAPSRSSTPWKTVGWVVGGAGVAGLALATVFGIVAAHEKSADCDGRVCDPGTTGAIKFAALASDIGWIAGGVLLATGAAMVLFTPGGGHEPSAAVKLAPAVTASGGGVVLGGGW